ncbi:MAG: sugar transferase [Gemmatimonadota bacterium]
MQAPELAEGDREAAPVTAQPTESGTPVRPALRIESAWDGPGSAENGRSDGRLEPEGHLESDGHLDVRLGLQRRAASNLRRHLLRAARRRSVLFFADLAAVVAVDVIVRSVRHGWSLGGGVTTFFAPLPPAGAIATPQYLVALFIGLIITGAYRSGDQRRSARRLGGAVWLAAMLQVWTAVWTRGLDLGVIQYFYTAVAVWTALLFERLTVDRIVARVSPPGAHSARTLFVGPAEQCREAAGSAAFRPGGEYSPRGFLDLRSPAAPDALGEIADLPRVLHDLQVETVVACGYIPDREFQDLVNISLASGCHLLAVPRSIEVAAVNPSLLWMRGSPLMQLTAPALHGQQLVLKRSMDILGSVLGIVVTAPLMLLIAIAVKLDAPGPVLFSQDRIGVGGRRFRFWKFRTMTYRVADTMHRDYMTRQARGDEITTRQVASDGKGVFKMIDDPRVTPVGRYLRRSSLDELPQFFNVLLGDMSLVGPRPPVPYEFEAYDHWQFDRLQVRPGMTGLWQVSGRSLIPFRQRCELDVDYVRRWSIWLDIKILLKTIPVVLTNSGRAA